MKPKHMIKKSLDSIYINKNNLNSVSLGSKLENKKHNENNKTYN